MAFSRLFLPRYRRHSVSRLSSPSPSPTSAPLFNLPALKKTLLLLLPPSCNGSHRAFSSSPSSPPKPQRQHKSAKEARDAREEIRRLDEEVRRLQRERSLVGKPRSGSSFNARRNDKLDRGGKSNRNDGDVDVEPSRKHREKNGVLGPRNASHNSDRRTDRARAAAIYDEKDDDDDDEIDDDSDGNIDDDDDYDETIDDDGEDDDDDDNDDGDEEEDVDDAMKFNKVSLSNPELDVESINGEDTSCNEKPILGVESKNPSGLKATQRPQSCNVDTLPTDLSPNSGDSAAPELELKTNKHPWKVWNAFFDMLKQNNYFEDVPNLDAILEGGGYLQFQDSTHMRRAVLEFSRERDDIIRFLTKKHIRTVVNVGCPVTDKKVVNASKRLRVLCEVPEDDVCQQCKLKTFCTRAFAGPSPNVQAETIDLTRVLYAFALNASPIAESQVSYPNGVLKSACHLLDEIIQVSAYPKNPGLPAPKSRAPLKPTAVKPTISENDENRRPGDWTCPDCHFLNFSKNRECRECGTFRESSKPLEPGDWECPRCSFVNFRRNWECRECLTNRPPSADFHDKEKMMRGDWECPECQFLNFRKNSECRRCSARRPENSEMQNVVVVDAGDWKCPNCNFLNFRRNKGCRECGAVCTDQSRSDERWGSKKASGWGSSSNVLQSTSSSGMGQGRIGVDKYVDSKLGPSRKASKDADDDLEEDADVVFQNNDDDVDGDSDGNAVAKSSKAYQMEAKLSADISRDGESASDLDFSDLDDTPVNKRKGKQNHATKNRKVVVEDDDDDDDDDDMEAELDNSEDDDLDDMEVQLDSSDDDGVSDKDQCISRPAAKQKPVKGMGYTDWNGDSDNDEDVFVKGKSQGARCRGGRNSSARGKIDPSDDSDVEDQGHNRGKGGRGGGGRGGGMRGWGRGEEIRGRVERGRGRGWGRDGDGGRGRRGDKFNSYEDSDDEYGGRDRRAGRRGRGWGRDDDNGGSRGARDDGKLGFLEDSDDENGSCNRGSGGIRGGRGRERGRGRGGGRDEINGGGRGRSSTRDGGKFDSFESSNDDIDYNRKEGRGRRRGWGRENEGNGYGRKGHGTRGSRDSW